MDTHILSLFLMGAWNKKKSLCDQFPICPSHIIEILFAVTESSKFQKPEGKSVGWYLVITACGHSGYCSITKQMDCHPHGTEHLLVKMLFSRISLVLVSVDNTCIIHYKYWFIKFHLYWFQWRIESYGVEMLYQKMSLVLVSVDSFVCCGAIQRPFHSIRDQVSE